MENTKQHEDRQAKNAPTCLEWEELQNDSILVKRCYIDIAGGALPAGLILSQIIYWHLPSKKDKSRLNVYRDGRFWLVKKHADWWTECRVKPKTAQRALEDLERLGVIESRIMKFGKVPHTHIALNVRKLDELIIEIIEKRRAECTAEETDDGTARGTEKGRKGSRSGHIDHMNMDNLSTSLQQRLPTETTVNELMPPSGKKSARRLRAREAFEHNLETAADVTADIMRCMTAQSEDVSAYERIPQVVVRFMNAYQQHTGEEHPRIKKQHWEKVVFTLARYLDDDTDIDAMIANYFSDPVLDCDHNIIHFAQPGILETRYMRTHGNGSLAGGCAS